MTKCREYSQLSKPLNVWLSLVLDNAAIQLLITRLLNYILGVAQMFTAYLDVPRVRAIHSLRSEATQLATRTIHSGNIGPGVM